MMLAVVCAGLPGWAGGRDAETAAARAARHARVAERRAGPAVIVHRGAWAVAPENSLAAYTAAMDLGADGCEVDLRRTHDGVLVMFHDDMLDRLTCGIGSVNDITFQEMLTLRPRRELGRNLFGGATTFSSVLDLARQRAMLLHLDVKEPGLEDDIARLLEEADAWEHVVSINTYNSSRLRQHPNFKPLAYKGPGLGDQRRDMDPAAVQAQLARPGQMIMVDDPRVAAYILKRPARLVAPMPVQGGDSPPKDTDSFPVEQWLARLKGGNAGTNAQHRMKSIIERAQAAQRLGESGESSPQSVAALEALVRHPTAHAAWRVHGLDASIAAWALGQLGATSSAPVLIEAFQSTGPVTNSLAGLRAKMHVLPALGELRCAMAKNFLLEYLAMNEAQARKSGPPQFEDATRALLHQQLSDAELAAVLRSANLAVRGTAILESLDRPTEQRSRVLNLAVPWALDLPRSPPGESR